MPDVSVFTPLSAHEISLACAGGVPVDLIHVYDVLDSTNLHLLDLTRRGAAHGAVVLAEAQTGGRGRRGRGWYSPAGQNLYLSCLLHAAPGLADPGAFALVAGLALAGVLSDAGVRGHGLKWPNDVLVQQQKLAGILVETAPLAQGGFGLVLGIGVNVSMREATLDQPWTSLARMAQGDVLLDRNVLAGRLLAALLPAYARFCREGLRPFLPAWSRYDVLDGQQVDVYGADVLSGTACGVTDQGFLRLRSGAHIHEIRAGDVRVRLSDE